MKKYLLGIVMVVVVITVVSTTSLQKDVELSDVALANVEALSNTESGGTTPTLRCWETVTSRGGSDPTHVTYCGDCDAVLARAWSDQSHCP